MFYQDKLWIAAGDNGKRMYLEPGKVNRHGLVAGATGTGKTVTLKVMAESLSDAGIPVFLADVKGDLAGLVRQGSANDKVTERVSRFGIGQEWSFRAFPVRFWDVFGKMGHAERTGYGLYKNVPGKYDMQMFESAVKYFRG